VQIELPPLLERLHADVFLSPGSFLPLRWRGPTVLTVHDLAQLARPAGWARRGELGPWIDFAVNTPPAMLRASAVVADSDYVARSIRRLIPWRPVTVVPLAAAPGFGADPGPAATAQAEALAPGEYVLYVGEIANRKNLTVLLEGFAISGLAARGTTLVLVGPDRAGHTGRVRRAAAELGIGAETRLVGVVPGPVLRALYRGATVTVVPSRHEGFGLPAVEAMASGTPVVAAAAGALAEVLGGAGVLFEARDAADLGARLFDVTSDSKLRAEMVAKGIARSASFSWEATAASTARVIEATAARGANLRT
jgi:glycosyltransferase involved in cell wall biosynthesis